MRLPTVLLLSFISLCESQFGFGFGGPAEEDFNDQFGLKESLGAWGNVLRNVAHRQLFGRPTPPPTDFQRITPPPNVEKIDPKLIANNGNEIINSRLLNMLLPRFKGQAPDVIAPHSKSQEEAATIKKKHQKSTTTAVPDSYEDEDDDDDGKESTTVASTTVTPSTVKSTSEATTVTTTTTEQSTTITTTTVENTTTKEVVTETTTEAPPSTTTTETTSTAKLAVKFHTAAKEKYDNDLEKEIEERVRQVVQELLDERLGKKKEATKKIDEMKRELKKEEVEKKKTGKVGESAEMEGHMKTIEEWIDEKVQKAMKSEDQMEQEKSEKSTNNDDNKPNAEKEKPENEHSDNDTSTTVETKLEKSEKMSIEETVVAKKTEDTSASTVPTSTSSAKAESTTLITTTTKANRESTKKPAKEPTKKDSKKEEMKKTAKIIEEKVEKKKSTRAHPKNVKHKKIAEDKAHKDFKVLKAVSMEDGTIDDVELFRHYKTIPEDGKVNKELEADYLNGEYEDEDDEKIETDDNLEMVEASGEPDEEAIDEDDIEETLSGENSPKAQKSPTIPEAEEEEEIAKEDDKYFRAHDAVTDAVSTTQEAGEETTLKPTTGTNVFNLQANANSDSHPNIANVMTPIAGIIDGISPILFPLLQSRPGLARAAARGAPNYQPDGNRDLLMDAQPETSLVGFGTQLAREILQPGSLQRDREEQEKAIAARAAAAKEKLRQKEFELQQYERQQEAQKQRLIERERNMNPARSNNPQPRIVENNVAFEQAFQGSSSFKQEIDTPTGPLLITPPPGVKGGKVPPPPPPGYIPKGYTGPIPPPDFVPQFLTSNEDSQSKVVQEVSGGTTAEVPYYPPKLTPTTPSPVKIENGPPPRKLSDERKRFSDLVKKRQGDIYAKDEGYEKGRNTVHSVFLEDSGLLAGDNSGSQPHAASIGQPLFGLVGNNGGADTAFGSASDNGLGFGGGKHPSVPFEEVERNTEKEEANFFG